MSAAAAVRPQPPALFLPQEPATSLGLPGNNGRKRPSPRELGRQEGSDRLRAGPGPSPPAVPPDPHGGRLWTIPCPAPTPGSARKGSVPLEQETPEITLLLQPFPPCGGGVLSVGKGLPLPTTPEGPSRPHMRPGAAQGADGVTLLFPRGPAVVQGWAEARTGRHGVGVWGQRGHPRAEAAVGSAQGCVPSTWNPARQIPRSQYVLAGHAGGAQDPGEDALRAPPPSVFVPTGHSCEEGEAPGSAGNGGQRLCSRSPSQSHAADDRAQATGREAPMAGWSQVRQVARFPCRPPAPAPTPSTPAAETPPWRYIRTK